MNLWAVTGTMLVVYEKSLSDKEATLERGRQSERQAESRSHHLSPCPTPALGIFRLGEPMQI